jgi:hypothetical protein
MKKSSFGVLMCTLLAGGISAPAGAQVSMSPSELGMAGAYDGVARGQESIFLNPALLGLPGTPYWSVAFPQVAVGGTLLGTRFGDLQPMTRYRRISPEQRDEILDRTHPEGTEARYDVRVPAAVVQVDRFGFGVAYHSVGGHTIGRDVMELFFDGYEEGRTDYRVGNTSGSRATYWDFAAAYGRAVGEVTLGATLHYYRGGTLLSSRMLEPRIDLDARDIEVDYRTVMVRGGSGYGVDLGAAYQPTRQITLSGSISNVLASMSWSEELRMRVLTVNSHDIEHSSAMDLLQRYETSETDMDPYGASLADYAVAERLFEGSAMPSLLRLGAAWQSSQGTELGLSYRSSMNESRLGPVWDRSLGVGVQQRIPYATIRGGYATSLDGGSMLAGGLTLGVMQLGFARLLDGELDGFERAGWIGSFGVAVRTTGSLR